MSLRVTIRRLLPDAVRHRIRTWRRTAPEARPALAIAWLRSGLRGEPGLMAFDGPPRVLYVCHGNILRSAFAAAVDREAGGAARSAGLHAIEGHPADETGQRIAAAMGIDLSGHRATPVSEELVSWADLIVAMDRSNQAELHARFPGARPRVRLVGMLSPGGPLEIPDPYGIGEDAVRAAFEMVRTRVLELHSTPGLSKDRARSP